MNCKNNTPAKADTCTCIIIKIILIIYTYFCWNVNVCGYFQKQNHKHEFHFNLRILKNVRGVLSYIVQKTLHVKTTQRISPILLPITAYINEYTHYFPIFSLIKLNYYKVCGLSSYSHSDHR